jgi:hypothetical protein
VDHSPNIEEWERAADQPDMPVELIRRLTGGGRGRAIVALDEARRLNDVGFHSPAYLWTVRAAEILMRDFVLAPRYMLEGLPWKKARDKGSRVLGANSWARAFAKAGEWYGPFDDPLTTDNRNAWKVWTKDAVPLRHQIVHGELVHMPTSDVVADAIAFVDRLISWWTQRLITSPRHPAGQEFREGLEQALQMTRSSDTEEE